MTDVVTYQRIVLKFQHAWNIGTETTKDWSVKFSLSGAVTMNDADAEATAIDLAQPIKQLTLASTSLIGFDYYPAGSHVATSFKAYTPGVHPGDGSAYSQSNTQLQQLEVCAVARCPVGKNNKGKPVFLRKFIHGVVSSAGDANALNPRTSDAATLTPWNQGSGPNRLVPVRPMTGAQGSGWVMESHLYTHQMRRGAKRKKPTQASLVTKLLDTAGDAAALYALYKSVA
jgi:hypothetical protein